MNWKNLTYIFLLACLLSCQQDLFEEGPVGNDKLEFFAEAPHNYLSTRSVENPVFTSGTHFHLYATKVDSQTAGEDWSVNYLHICDDPSSHSSEAGIAVGTSDSASPDILRLTYSEEHNLHKLAQNFLAKPLNFYGVTVVGAREDDKGLHEGELEITNELLHEYYSNGKNDIDANGIRRYDVVYKKYEAEGANMMPFPDIMWSGSLKNQTPYENAGRIILPFIHTLSKINFKFTLADDLDASIDKVKVKSLTLNDYNNGKLNVHTGLYERNVTKRDVIVDVNIDEHKALEYSQAGKELIQFATNLVFPTTSAGYEKSQSADSGDDDLENIGEDHAIFVDLTVDINGREKKFEHIALVNYGVYQVFHPNYEYDVTFSLTTNTVVVTVRPKYYEYFEEEIELGLSEVGEPVDFGGMLWAAANIGATSANPIMSALDWEKSRGFYYQYGRSVPYYVRGSILDPFPYISTDRDTPYNANNPAASWDREIEQFLYVGQTGQKDYHAPYGNTVYAGESNHGARAYPYIPVLWEREIEAAGGDVSTGYKNYLRKYRYYSTKTTSNGQTAPDINYADPYYAKDLPVGKENRFAFSTYYNDRLWNQTDWNADVAPDNWIEVGANYNDPCPKGWRMPNLNEFLSIFPPGMKFGDISFTGNIPDATEGKHPGERVYMEKNMKDEAGYVEDYKHESAVYVGIYQDGKGFDDIGSRYLAGYDAQEGWGTVYAIKCMGTDDAYALSWHIEIADYEEVTAGKVYPACYNVSPEHAYVGRGVLVISKYDLGINRERMGITYEQLYGADNKPIPNSSKDAQYRCIIFADTNDNFKYDEGEDIGMDWQHPAGVLYLPIPGYVIVNSGGGQALIYPGCEALYWTSSNGKSGNRPVGKAVRIKYAGDYLSRYLYVSSDEYVANGAHVRCVRDTKASYL